MELGKMGAHTMGWNLGHIEAYKAAASKCTQSTQYMVVGKF